MECKILPLFADLKASIRGEYFVPSPGESAIEKICSHLTPLFSWKTELTHMYSMQGLPPFFPPGAYSGRDMDHPLGARSFSALTSEVAWWTGSTGTSPTVPFNLHLQQSLHKKL